MIHGTTVACTYFAPIELIHAQGKSVVDDLVITQDLARRSPPFETKPRQKNRQKYAIICGEHYRKSELSTISSGDKDTV